MNIKEIIGELNVGAHGICLALQGRIPVADL